MPRKRSTCQEEGWKERKESRDLQRTRDEKKITKEETELEGKRETEKWREMK